MFSRILNSYWVFRCPPTSTFFAIFILTFKSIYLEQIKTNIKFRETKSEFVNYVMNSIKKVGIIYLFLHLFQFHVRSFIIALVQS